MAAYSIPDQYCSADYSSLSSEFCSFPICEQTPEMFNNNNNYNMEPLMNYDIYSPVSVASFPQDHHHHQQQFGLVNSDSSVSEIESGFSNFAVNCHYQNDHQVFEPGDECFNGLLPNFYNNLMAAENWKLKGNNQVITNVEETEVKVGRYSAEERKDRILRYLKKRNQRNFNKTIKYACRKTLADKRVRVRGRFAKNNEPACEDTNPHNMTSYEPNSLSNFVDSIQMKYDEDCCFEAAITNLMHLPNYC